MRKRDARGRFRKPTDEERGFPPGFLDTMRKRFDSAKYEFGIVQLAAKAVPFVGNQSATHESGMAIKSTRIFLIVMMILLWVPAIGIGLMCRPFYLVWQRWQR